MDRCLYHRSTIRNSPPESPRTWRRLNYLYFRGVPFRSRLKSSGKPVCGSAPSSPCLNISHRFSVVGNAGWLFTPEICPIAWGQLTSVHSGNQMGKGGEVAYFNGQGSLCLWHIAEDVLCSQRAELELPVWAITAYTEYKTSLHYWGRTPSLVPGRLWLPNTVHEGRCHLAVIKLRVVPLLDWLSEWLLDWQVKWSRMEPALGTPGELVFHLCSFRVPAGGIMHAWFPLRFITCISGTLFWGKKYK